MTETACLLTLLKTPRFGRKKAWKIVPALRRHAPAGVRELRDMLLESGFHHYEIPGVDTLNASHSQAMDLLEVADGMGIGTLWPGSRHYPPRLRGIGDPPLLLFVKGSQDCLLDERACAVVGTRRPSPYGLEYAREIGAMLAGKGYVVIGGLARGCDTAAHQGCVQENGRTVAVLAHGLDRVYPPENRALADRIAAAEGCLVSEYPPGEWIFKYSFVERDRIQSGLCSGLIVIEAEIEGGVMYTVRFALEQGRPVACLRYPEQMASISKAQGNRKLIMEGKARPLSGLPEAEAFLLEISGSGEISGHGSGSGVGGSSPGSGGGSPGPGETGRYLQPALWGDDGGGSAS
jgi:DNA processing protein